MIKTDCIRRAWLEVDLNAIKQNFNLLKNICKKNICAVVKADAYGHGAVKVAAALETEGVACFAVSNIVEAIELRAGGINTPILILGYTPADLVSQLAAYNITQCVFSKEYAQSLSCNAQQENVTLNVHLKLDTGMGRIGFDCRSDDLKDINAVKETLQLENLNFSGIFAHFAVADGISKSDTDFTLCQYNRFLTAIKLLESGSHKFVTKHCGNSAAALSLSLDGTDTVRAGIILYGIAPDFSFPLPCDFMPAMSMYSVISQVKTVKSGETVSYGRTFKADRDRRIATVSAGYADGIPRLLSNNGYMLVKGKKAPIVGRVCMDQLCLDVTEIDGVCEGDTVTVFGKSLPVEEVACMAQTISYEIICGISKRVPTVYI